MAWDAVVVILSGVNREILRGPDCSRLIAVMASDEDFSQAVKNLFDSIDTRRNGFIESEELRVAIETFKAAQVPVQGLEALERLAAEKSALGQDSKIDFGTFKQAATKLPRLKEQKAQWIRSLKLENTLALYLKAGTLFDGLSGVKSMSDSELEISANLFCQELVGILQHARDSLLSLSNTYEANVDSVIFDHKSVMSKYQDEGGFLGNYGNKEMFLGGLENELGFADPCVMMAILHEHMRAVDSDEIFETSNYRLRTTPILEIARVLGCKSEYDGNSGHVSAVPTCLSDLAQCGEARRGPTASELRDLEDSFAELRRISDEVASSTSGGLFPGDVGDEFVDAVMDICAVAAAPEAAPPLKTALNAFIARSGRLGPSFHTLSRGLNVISPVSVAGSCAVASVSAQLVDDAETCCRALAQALRADLGPDCVELSVRITRQARYAYCAHGDEAGLLEATAPPAEASPPDSAAAAAATTTNARAAALTAFREESRALEARGAVRRQGRRRLPLRELMALAPG